MIAALAAAAVLAGAPAPGDNAERERTAPTLSHAQTQFMLRCGGCHGIHGRSPPGQVPSLRGAAGYFLCTPEGREYAIRLPNVSRTPLSDGDLADVMNYVMFGLGEGGAPAGAKPYSAEEVGALRKAPLTGLELTERRNKVVRKLVQSCGAPADLLSYLRR